MNKFSKTEYRRHLDDKLYHYSVVIMFASIVICFFVIGRLNFLAIQDDYQYHQSMEQMRHQLKK